MAFLKIKMDLQFPKFPIIYLWIQTAYDKCSTEEDYKDFMWECFDIAHDTQNEVKKQAYYNTACVVYSKLTGKSWEALNKSIEAWIS